MKKRTVITTEKLEIWFVPQPSEVHAGVAQAPETDGWHLESGNQSLTLPEEYPDKNVPPTHED